MAFINGKEILFSAKFGESAYEIAVRHGFVGSEEEWLESLTGADGDTPYIQNGYWYIGGENTGVKAAGEDGQDYVLTEADKNDIASLTAILLRENGVFGVVDANNNIIVSGNLADGTYLIKYEMEDGSKVDIGSLVLGTPSRLPSEYQEVEWVQIVNSENVDVHSGVHTTIPWSGATKIVAKLQNVTSTNVNDIIICAWSSTTAKAAPYIATRTAKTANMFAYTSGLTNFTVSPNNIAPTDMNVNTFTFSFTHTSSTDICFGAWYDATYSHPHKWYSVEIYNGDTLLGQFVPCYRKADNINGFYDLVGGAFYANCNGESGSNGKFLYRGNDV